MNSNFKQSLKYVLAHEGGYVDHPKDPGGATNKGVTIATFRRYVKKNGTKADLKRITDAQVEKVYRKHYWDAVKGDDLPSGIDYAVFDFAVNSGPTRAAKFLQDVLGVPQDGKIGPVTLAVAHKKDARKVIDSLCGNRLAWMKRLKTWGTFGRGWTARVSAVETHAMEMANHKPADAPQPVPVPEHQTEQESAPRGNTGRNSGIALIVATIGGAAAMFWDKIEAAIGAIF